jgi:hypothetical protein
MLNPAMIIRYLAQLCPGRVKVIALISIISLSPTWASGTTITRDPSDPSIAIGITDLAVDGTVYNVEFPHAGYDTVYATTPPTFLGNFDGALSANQSILDLFLGVPPDDPIHYVTGGLIAYAIPFELALGQKGERLAIALEMGIRDPDWRRGLGYTTDFNNPIEHVAYTVFIPVGQTVPEPSTMLLLASGLLGLVGLNRRRKK